MIQREPLSMKDLTDKEILASCLLYTLSLTVT